jgi:hypothetical protein
MIEFSELFNEIVANISPIIDVNYQSGTKYYVCGTKWSRKGKFVTGLDSSGLPVKKLITNILVNEYIELEDDLIVGETLTIDTPFNITGTKIATNLEWTKASKSAIEKTPIIWLLDSFEETTYGRESSIERTVDCKIFFLDETDIKNYYTSDHKEQVIQPMMFLKDEFLNVIKKNRKYKTIADERIRYFSRFGTESSQGFEKNILDANLSGLVLSVTLTKFKENCRC